MLVSAELAMQMLSSSLCGTEGCRIVATHARYGDMTMLLPGMAAFAILASLSAVNLFLRERRLDLFINVALITALSAEGFLVGYQAFRIHTPCLFCLLVFAVFVVLGVMRVAGGHREVISGFAGFIITFSLFYLVLPAASNCDCLQNDRLVLFYSEDCAHCETVKKLCRDCDLHVNEVPAKDHGAFLKSMNIDEAPVLFVNDGPEKRILIGEARITKYLLDNDRNRKMSEWMSEVFTSSAHASTCKVGTPCEH